MANEERLVFRVATPWFWWTIYEPGQRWTILRVLNVLIFVALSPLIILVAILAAILSKPPLGRLTRSPDEVAQYIWNEAQGKGQLRDWDDFVSIPIADPELDAIRLEAASLAHPLRTYREELLALAEQARLLR